MPNDFLSNLSARVLQHTEVDVPGSGLKPRLASRFENVHAPAGSVVDQAPDQDSRVDVEANAETGLRNPATAPDQTPIGRRYPAPYEGLDSGILAAQEHRYEEPKHFYENHGMSAMRDPLKPRPATEHSHALPQTLMPTHAQTEFPSLARKDSNAVQTNILPVSPVVPPRAEVQKTIESHTIIREVQPPSTDSKKATPVSDLSAALSSSQTKVVPERIEVTHLERQPQAPPKGSQIVPSLELSNFKSQSRMLDTQEQPATIHVTIGRIEVKASPPAAVPKRPTPASTTMSLEEYLRRRSGGDK